MTAATATFWLSKHFRISLEISRTTSCSVLAADLKPNSDDERMLFSEKYIESCSLM